jgi:uncharacterized membrane protein YgcG
VRFLYKQRFDQKAFTASLIELAVKGAMTIKKIKSKFTLENRSDTGRLRPEEKDAHELLFAKSDELKVNRENHDRFYLAELKLEKSAKKDWDIAALCEGNYILSGRASILAGFIMFGYMVITGWESVANACIVAPFILYGIFRLGYHLKNWSRAVNWSFIIGGLSISYFAVALIITDADAETGFNVQDLLFFLLTSAICIHLTRRIKFYSAEYLQIQSELEGFRMYMQTAEEHRLNLLTPPEHTPELFEKLLPYAIALDVSNAWCKKFNNALKKLNYQPEWYTSTDSFSTVGVAASLSAMTSSLNTSVNRAAHVSSDSSGSGSGGGGYSGGGGGGGGGRGW